MEDLTLLQLVLLFAFPGIMAITVHEVAHGYAALYFGDKTALMLGRLTFNPLKHIDPIGTIAVPLGLLVMSKISGTPPFVFGWAKPVPIGVRNLRNPQRDMSIVAAAGPASNLAMAAGWTLVLGLITATNSSLELLDLLAYMAYFGVLFNVLLAVFNMLPIPPLDGGRVVSGLLPPRVSFKFDQIERFGFMIVIGLIMTGVLSKIMWPIVSVIVDFFMGFIGA